MRLVACLRTDFDMEIQHSQLKINHLSDTPSTKAAGGGIFSGVFTQGRPGTIQGQEDFEISWYLFFQQGGQQEIKFPSPKKRQGCEKETLNNQSCPP
jgi:hypothetical protein